MSDDQEKIDLEIYFTFGLLISDVFDMCGDVIAAVVVTRYLAVVILPLSWIYFKLSKVYVRASREICRLKSLAQSPAISFASECIDGVYIIRAFDASERFIRKNNVLLDDYSTMTHFADGAAMWFMLRTQAVGITILLAISIIVFMNRDRLSPGLIGLCIFYGLNISSSLQDAVHSYAEFEVLMIAPERVLQYIDIPGEGKQLQKVIFLEFPPTII
jgi:ABC-type multidrug transport system fused ATPase/permease subunit